MFSGIQPSGLQPLPDVLSSYPAASTVTVVLTRASTRAGMGAAVDEEARDKGRGSGPKGSRVNVSLCIDLISTIIETAGWLFTLHIVIASSRVRSSTCLYCDRKGLYLVRMYKKEA